MHKILIVGVSACYMYIDELESLVEEFKEVDPIKEIHVHKRREEPFKILQNNDWRKKGKKFNGYNGAN